MFFQLTIKQQLLISIVNSFAVISESIDIVYMQQPIKKIVKILAKWRYFAADIAGFHTYMKYVSWSCSSWEINKHMELISGGRSCWNLDAEAVLHYCPFLSSDIELWLGYVVTKICCLI